MCNWVSRVKELLKLALCFALRTCTKALLLFPWWRCLSFQVGAVLGVASKAPTDPPGSPREFLMLWSSTWCWVASLLP